MYMYYTIVVYVNQHRSPRVRCNLDSIPDRVKPKASPLSTCHYGDWLAWHRDIVSEWSYMSTHGQLFLWARTMKSQLSVLV